VIIQFEIARSVPIFLGVPFAAGYLIRRFGEKARGRAWYESRFLPRIGPAALYGLLEFPKPLTTGAVEAADVVITMGCEDACPLYPDKRYLDWELTDPAGKTVEEVRQVLSFTHSA
jgi:hypothetical protein